MDNMIDLNDLNDLKYPNDFDNIERSSVLLVTLPEFDVIRIAALQEELTAQWHIECAIIDGEPPYDCIVHNHRMNFHLWHEEDIARRDDLGAERVRDAKRTIDRYNQERNDAIERMDAWIHERLPIISESSGVPLHSETPGMMVDRLSILALKCYHMEEQAFREGATPVHREVCMQKRDVLSRQRADLQRCLELLMLQLNAGERSFRIYKQYKMYNDPDLNPQLYLEANCSHPA